MKKILCIFVVLVITLSGCEKTKKVQNEIPDFIGYKARVVTTVNDVEIHADAHYLETDSFQLTFVAPETLKDMKIIVKDGECEVTLDSLSFNFALETLSFNSLIVSLKSCGDNIKSATCKKNIYQFASMNNTCELELDETTKKFKKLIINGKNTVVFESFDYILGQSV